VSCSLSPQLDQEIREFCLRNLFHAFLLKNELDSPRFVHAFIEELPNEALDRSRKTAGLDPFRVMMLRLVSVQNHTRELAMVEQMNLYRAAHSFPTTPVDFEPFSRRELVPNFPTTVLEIPDTFFCFSRRIENGHLVPILVNPFPWMCSVHFLMSDVLCGCTGWGRGGAGALRGRIRRVLLLERVGEARGMVLVFIVVHLSRNLVGSVHVLLHVHGELVGGMGMGALVMVRVHVPTARTVVLLLLLLME